MWLFSRLMYMLLLSSWRIYDSRTEIHESFRNDNEYFYEKVFLLTFHIKNIFPWNTRGEESNVSENRSYTSLVLDVARGRYKRS